MKRKVDIGQVYGRLTVLRKADERRGGQVMWECRCSCPLDKVVLVASGNLAGGRTQSCGCIRKEWLCSEAGRQAGEKGAAVNRMGEKSELRQGTKNSWKNMIARCLHTTCRQYPHYGAKGVRVDPAWCGPEGFALFQEEMGDRPEGASIDRIDPKGNYEPSNCRWATPKQQTRNRSNTIFITIDGVEKSMAEWAEIYGIGYDVVIARRQRKVPDTQLFNPVKRNSRSK